MVTLSEKSILSEEKTYTQRQNPATRNKDRNAFSLKVEAKLF